MSIKVFPLGAGQDVGRSCVIATIGGKRIMFDCGIHMIDKQKFPDFSYLAEENKTMDDVIDCVIITHFHLDHCGAIVQFSEMVGYNGPIIMTHPTRAIIPLMLEDLRRITIKQKGTEADFFTSDMIHRSMEKVTIIKLHETINIKDMKITAYYAGHVLGAAMFHVECGGQSVVYTGDFNMTADRHLGSAWIEKLKPDCLIMETTYATTIRDSKKSREREFLKKVEETLERNGKVLIPVFALGRAQELCILLETFCRRTNQKAPIYFSTGMTEKANFYYKLFVNWTNEKIKNSFIEESIFDFEHVKPFDKIYIKSKKPMVLFATPGMLHAGTSLNVFKEWASDPRNTVIIPGYCVPGTVGNKLLQGASKVEIDKKVVEVKCEIANLSFSAHADSKGLMQIIAHVEPKSVILVHGEKENMRIFAEKVESVFKIPCFYPPNYSMTHIASDLSIPLKISSVLVKETLHNHQIRLLMKEYLYNKKEVLLEDRLFSQLYNVRIENLELNGLLVIKNETELSLCSIKEAGEVSNGFLDSYDIEYFYQKAIPKGFENEDIITEFIKSMTKKLGIKEEAGGSTGTFFDIVFTREVDNIINIYWKEKDDALAQCVMDYFEDFCKNLLLELD